MGRRRFSDFPVAVIVASDPELAAHARADGADLVVTAVDGLSRLDAELVSFGGATGALELWVRIPTLAPTTTTLYLYYGGAAAAGSTTAVWSSRFAGVWHLSDPGTGARDSTSHAHHLSATGATAPGHVAGVAGEARDHDGLDDKLDLADPADGSLDFGLTSFSFSLWVNEVFAQNAYDTPFYKGGASAIHPGYGLLLGTAEWEAKLHDGTQFDNVFFGMEPALANRWVHLVTVVDRGASKLTAYTNGALNQEVDLTIGSIASAEPFDLGFGPVGAQPFRGRIDEVRIYTSTLDAAWIAAEHANLTDPSFVTVEAEQTCPVTACPN